MRVGMIGLGRMGGAMAARMRAAGIEVVGFDRDPASARDATSVEGLLDALPTPRVLWVMVPAGEPTRATIARLAELADPGDLVIDGGNSPATDDAAHAELLAERGIDYLDVGVSGGVWGREEGYALMVGGEPGPVDRAMPLFDALRPEGPGGFVHAGPIGAGHFAKMVHNGIEYGMMQALGEGYEVMAATPLIADPDAVVDSWRSGTVIRSWLLDLLARALADDPGLAAVPGRAADSGEARWMIEAALGLGVPVPVTAASLHARQASRIDDPATMRVVAALRERFGGHRTG